MKRLLFALVLALHSPLLWAGDLLSPGDLQELEFQPRVFNNFGLTRTHTVSITIDDGPSLHTLAMLDVLKRHNVLATFFINGENVNSTTEPYLRETTREGHLLANHGQHHQSMRRSIFNNDDYLRHMISDTDDYILIYGNFGDPLYYRPPYGDWLPSRAVTLNKDPYLRNYVGPIYWNIGGENSRNPDGSLRSAADWDCWSHRMSVEQCTAGYVAETVRKDGGVMLMHDSNSYPQSVEMLDRYLTELESRGFQFIRLDKAPGIGAISGSSSTNQ